jgi:hypothetical protein
MLKLAISIKNTLQAMKLTKTFKAFFESEKAGGLLLLFVTILSLSLANSSIQTDYIAFWKTPLGHHTITDWINDGIEVEVPISGRRGLHRRLQDYQRILNNK